MIDYYKSIPEEHQDFVEVPADQSAVGKYTFKIVSEMEHSRGVSWVGKIAQAKTKVVVCKVENTGTGGCNNYSPSDDALYAQFVKDAQKTYPDSFEAEDSFVQLLDVLSMVTA
jgi:hypothetical protein